MSDSSLTCMCGEPMRPNGNFCRRCGQEIRPYCPVCFTERRLIAICDPHATPWCDNRGEILFACARCGRWFPADVRLCPDPKCRGSVGPNWPASTGRAMDGTGHAGEWRWPAVWDRQNPRYTAPRQDAWRSEAPVQAAFMAYGRVYVWTDKFLVVPEGEAGGPLAGLQKGEAGAQWRCWLTLDGQPDPRLSISNRVALVGGGVVLAANNDFLLAGLSPNRTEDVIPLHLGAPLAQAAAEGWWVGWSQGANGPALWLAAISTYWRNLEYQQVTDVPPQAAPRPNAPLILKEGLACWIGEDGALWQLDCRSRDLRRLTDPLDGAQRVWRDSEGLHTVRVTENGLYVGRDALSSAGGRGMWPAGPGPLRDLFAAPGLLAVVGETVTPLSSNTGESIGGGRYSGQWITGVMAEAQSGAADQEPRLLMLTDDGGSGNLSALHPLSGSEEGVWREAGVRPLSLITAGESLYVVHERGVTRIQEAL